GRCVNQRLKEHLNARNGHLFEHRQECSGNGPMLNKTVISCIYRCHSDFNLFIEKLEQIVMFCSNNTYDLVFLGNFNVNMLGNDNKKNQLVELFETYGIKNFIETQTRPASNSLLDLAEIGRASCRE